MKQKDSLTRSFAVLADPTRRAILAQLATGEKTVNELAEPFDLSLPAISKHLKVLERAKFITRSRSAQRRPCRLCTEPLEEVDDWIDHYRRFWAESFDRLAEHLKEMQASSKQEKRHDRPRRRLRKS
ncbi:MAG TPA: metalloregulator ArsR/SmtB family transcription factor [Planctomycetaceae bacterium]|nr:metalloregulator ArsR/SmtB family transcription factor [Planctomycetaceae bacterium]